MTAPGRRAIRRLRSGLVVLALLAALGPTGLTEPPPPVFGMASPAAAPRSVPALTGRSGPGGAMADLPLPEHDPAEVRSTARRVLARPEFREPGRSLLQRIWDWFFDVVEGAVDGLLSGGRAGAFAWVLLPAAVVLLAFFLLRFTRGITGDAARRTEHGAEPRRPPEDWRAEAEINARAGRWREAVRCRYRALVADLGSRGLLEEVPGRTAGEYRSEVAASAPGLAAEFAQASELFEVAWYGHQPTGEQQDETLRVLAERVSG